MKTLIFSLITSAFLSHTALAGSYADPVIEAPVIIEETTTSSAGATLPLLMALIVLGVAISQ